MCKGGTLRILLPIAPPLITPSAAASWICHFKHDNAAAFTNRMILLVSKPETFRNDILVYNVIGRDVPEADCGLLSEKHPSILGWLDMI